MFPVTDFSYALTRFREAASDRSVATLRGAQDLALAAVDLTNESLVRSAEDRAAVYEAARQGLATAAERHVSVRDRLSLYGSHLAARHAPVTEAELAALNALETQAMALSHTRLVMAGMMAAVATGDTRQLHWLV